MYVTLVTDLRLCGIFVGLQDDDVPENVGDSIKLKGKAEGFEVLKLESLSGR